MSDFKNWLWKSHPTEGIFSRYLQSCMKEADGTKKFRQWQELYIQLTWFNVFNQKIFLSVSLTYRIIQLEVLSPSWEMSLSRIKRGFLSSTSSVLCTPTCIVHTYKCTDINTDNNTLWDICYQFEPLFENFQVNIYI